MFLSKVHVFVHYVGFGEAYLPYRAVGLLAEHFWQFVVVGQMQSDVCVHEEYLLPH
jgi:hypothetical protein